MSRTFRRNKQTQIHNFIGSFEDYLAYEVWWAHYCGGARLHEFYSEENQKRLLREYLEKVTDYTRDNHSGHYGVPRWFRNEFTREERRQQRHEIFRCRTNDEWDDFLVFKNPDQAKLYWW